jgi:hypothetical protein
LISGERGTAAGAFSQQAIYTLGADEITAEYRVRYGGNAPSFAWVVPVPGVVTAVEAGDAATFDAVAELTAPRILGELDDSDAFDDDCGCDEDEDDDDDGPDAMDTGTRFSMSDFVGTVEYAVVGGADADGIADWLEAAGFDPRPLADALELYVEGTEGYEWVVAVVAPESLDTGQGSSVELAPLRIRYAAPEGGTLVASFPARMGSTSMFPESGMEIYVLGTGLAAMTGWTVAEQARGEGGLGPDLVAYDGERPEDVYADHLRAVAAGGAGAYLVYAGDYRDGEGAPWWLTRFDAILPPSVLTVDPWVADTGARRDVQTVIVVVEESRPDTGTLLPLVLFAWIVRRR